MRENTRQIEENQRSISYTQVLRESAPLLGLLLVFSAVGYYLVSTWWWAVVFVFGAIAAFTNRLYYQKTVNLREQLRNR